MLLSAIVTDKHENEEIKMTNYLRIALIGVCLGAWGAEGRAALFTDDFEGDLSAWTGQGGGAHSGLIVVDPLNAGNNVLSFTALGSAGDIFTAQQLNLNPGATYQISFDYLGLPTVGSVAGNLGGFAGISEGLAGRHMWYYGTTANSGATDTLVDDGQWASYVFQFIAPVNFTFGGGSGNAIRLMFEDFTGSGGVAGDVYFDNVELSAAVPEPTSALLLGAGLLVLAVRRRRARAGLSR